MSGAPGAQRAASPADTADLLVEALPYIRRFAGRIVVVKYGGNALAASGTDGAGTDGAGTDGAGTDGAGNGGGIDPQRRALASFAEDIALLRSVGILPVVVHGGGPQIGELMQRLGKEPVFRDGLRVTDAETLDIARMVLVGKVNSDIVSAVNVHGPLAVGVSGEDANLITAVERDGGLGFVGEIVLVDPSMLRHLLAEGLVPVVATIGADAGGQAYNINADTVAGALAEALGAEKLVFLTDVEGIRADPADPASLQPTIGADDLELLVSRGGAVGGMVPKVEACVRAVRSGVPSAHVLDGRVPHAVLLELFTDAGVGTMVTP